MQPRPLIEQTNYSSKLIADEVIFEMSSINYQNEKKIQ